MVRIPHALIKKHRHLLASPLHQSQQGQWRDRLVGDHQVPLCFMHLPSSCIPAPSKCFSPRKLKRKTTGLWSGPCLLSIKEAWLAFSSSGLHIYQGKLETQEGVLLSNNHARLLDLSAYEWNQQRVKPM